MDKLFSSLHSYIRSNSQSYTNATTISCSLAECMHNVSRLALFSIVLLIRLVVIECDIEDD